MSSSSIIFKVKHSRLFNPLLRLAFSLEDAFLIPELCTPESPFLRIIVHPLRNSILGLKKIAKTVLNLLAR